MQCDLYPDKVDEHMVLENVFYLSPEKLIFTEPGSSSLLPSDIYYLAT